MAEHLTTPQRQTIIVLNEEGYSLRRIANRVGCSLHAVQETIARYEQTGSLNERDDQSSEPTLNPQAMRALRSFIRRTPSATSLELAQCIYQRYHVRVSARTIRRYRVAMGFRPVHERVRQQLTPRNISMRLAYARRHRGDQWTRTIFVDEKIFAIDRGGRVLWLEPGVPRPTHDVVDTHIRIHVWGAVWYQGRSHVARIVGRMDSALYTQVLQQGLTNYLPQLHRHTLYQDGAPAHWGQAATAWLDNHHVPYYTNVPGNSPELNAIESVWSWMVNYIQARAPTTRVQLDNLIDEAWTAIPQTTIQAYIRHTRTVVHDIIVEQGGPVPH